jgi:hypothetical protein
MFNIHIATMFNISEYWTFHVCVCVYNSILKKNENEH